MSTTAPASTQRRGTRSGVRGRRAQRHPEGLDRLRILLAGAMGAILVGYALLVPVAALLLASGGSGSLDGAFAIAVPMWLAAHQIPVRVDGMALGVLPLLPTAVVVVVVAVASAWSVRRLGRRIRHDAGPVVAGQAGAAAAVAVLAGALLPGDVSVTTPWASMVGAGLLAGLAAGVGVLRVCGLPPAWARRLLGWPRAGLSGAAAGGLGLLAAGTLVVLLGLVLNAGAVADSFAGLAPGAGASAGVLLLAVGYLPNSLVAGVAWALGPGFSVGAAQSGPFGTDPGPLPPFPLFAAVPTEQVPGWAALVMVLPLGAGVLTGLVCRRALGADAPVWERVAAAVAATGATAVGAATVAAVAGGTLAGGPYDPVSLSPLGVLASALLLLGVPATLVAVGVEELLLGRTSAARRAVGGRAGGGGRRSTRSDRAAAVRSARERRSGTGDAPPRDSGRTTTARKGSGGAATAREDSGGSATAREDSGGSTTARKATDRKATDRKAIDRRDAGQSTARTGAGTGSVRTATARKEPGRPGTDRTSPGRSGSDRSSSGRDGARRTGTARGRVGADGSVDGSVDGSLDHSADDPGVGSGGDTRRGRPSGTAGAGTEPPRTVADLVARRTASEERGGSADTGDPTSGADR